MDFKLLALVSCLLAVAHCGVIADDNHEQQEDLSHYDFGHGDHEAIDYHSHPRYEYSYEVQDDHTGDVKSAHESRDGDTVRGSYTVLDPDGHKRTVEYTADGHEGFKAVVRREPVPGHVATYSDHRQAEEVSDYQGQGYETEQAYEGDHHGYEAQEYEAQAQAQEYEDHSSSYH